MRMSNFEPKVHAAAPSASHCKPEQVEHDGMQHTAHMHAI